MIEPIQTATGKIIGGLVIISSYLYAQTSDVVGGVINKGLDAGLSVGLLVIGIVVLARYFHKDKKHSRDLIGQMAKDKDELFTKIAEDQEDFKNEFKELSKQQIELSKDQINSNKEVHEAIVELKKAIRE